MRDETRGTLLEHAAFGAAVRELAHYDSDEGVLSVYLDLDPALAVREGYEAVLMDLWKPLRALQHDDRVRSRLEYEIAGITEEVRSWSEAPGRAIVMFLSGPGGLCTILPLQFPIRSMARFEPRPVLGPLIAALEEHERYCIVIFAKDQARIITVFLGEVEEEETLHSDVIGRSAVGGWAQARYARHRENQVHEHARRTLEHLWAIDRSRPLHALVLAGPDEALAELRRMLPKALARIVVDTIPAEMFAVTADVVKRVALIEREARDKRNLEIVQDLTTTAAKGDAAITGWQDTLDALCAGRVHMLVVPAEGRVKAGVQCPDGHYIGVHAVTNCPVCDEPTWPATDVLEAAVRMAMSTDAVVLFVGPDAADALGSAGIGALLRY
jgi:peptide chain release factor subunit 1